MRAVIERKLRVCLRSATMGRWWTRNPELERNQWKQRLPVLLQSMVCLHIVLSCAFFSAASTTMDHKPAGPPLEHSEAQRYAQHLSGTIKQIRDDYVRPVAQAPLVTAALKGLYEAARLPV